MIKDFHVTVRVKNNQLVERREALGMSLREFSEAAGVHYSLYVSLETMRHKPLNMKTGNIRPMARRVMNFLGASFEDLWPETVRAIVNNKTVRRVDGEFMAELVGQHTQRMALPPDELYDQREKETTLSSAMDSTLTDREREVLKRRFGLDENSKETCGDIGDTMEASDGVMGISRNRVLQIEGKALRKLRHSLRSKQLRDLIMER